MCGDALQEFSLCHGRTGPELGATLFQLEKFLEQNASSEAEYMRQPIRSFAEVPNLFPADQFPELEPYKSLDAARLRLVGTGKWDMQSWLTGSLWLPFQEPAFLLHGLEVNPDEVPDFSREDPDECLKLARLWDTRGLLFLAPKPAAPGFFSRVFNAHKNKECGRQIGDRRLPNQSEYHVDGPSKFLPQGQQLVCLHAERFKEVIRASITDRRDFYHQASVSDERALTNMLPFSYPTTEFEGTAALEDFRKRWNEKTDLSREKAGDDLKKERRKRQKHDPEPEALFPCFRSLFQGDHLGVEFALQSHSMLLEESGLLGEKTRVQGHHEFPGGKKWDALVIDDYFCLGAEAISAPAEKSFAFASLATARQIYETADLKGSPEKDVVADTEVKVADAEIRSGIKNVRLGFIPIGAPIAKRVALSMVSLRAACLPGVSQKLTARLAGNWVAVLQYRKCLSSIIDGLFKLSSECMSVDEKTILPLPRNIAQELTILAAVSPMMVSNLSTTYHGRIYAADASNQKGAIVSAEVPKEIQENLWLSADKKGAYTNLSNCFHATLRGIGEADDDLETAAHAAAFNPPQKAPLMYFDFVEFCGGSGKVTDAVAARGRVCAPVLDLSESSHYNLGSLRLFEWSCFMIAENRIRSFLVAPPCTTFSPAAHPAVRSYANPLGFCRDDPKTLNGNLTAFRALLLLRQGRRHRRPCSLEQSRLSKMAWLSTWKSLLDQDFEEAVIASCAFGSIHKKEFRLLCYLLDVGFLDRRCPGFHSHVRIEGSYTKPSAVYVDGLAEHIAQAFCLSLDALDAENRLDVSLEGLEDTLANDVMLTAPWRAERAWHWKKLSHINVLELASAVSEVIEIAETEESIRFSSFIDSAVCRGALSKGRSASTLLQPGLKRICACQIASDLYPGWIYSPTRLNCADDPTRDAPLRLPVDFSLTKLLGVEDIRLAGLPKVRRCGANFCHQHSRVRRYPPPRAAKWI